MQDAPAQVGVKQSVDACTAAAFVCARQRKAEDEPGEVADEEESGGAGQSDHVPANADAPACDRPQEIAHATAAGDEPHGQKRGERRRVRRQLDPNAHDDRHWRRKSKRAQIQLIEVERQHAQARDLGAGQGPPMPPPPQAKGPAAGGVARQARTEFVILFVLKEPAPKVDAK